jgi:hypothetical protein
MNRATYFLLALMIATLFPSCEEKLVYKYQNRPQLVDCPGIDKALINEAIYSFMEDISSHYNVTGDLPENSNDYYINGYQNFVQSGLEGVAPFKEIVSQHSIKLLEKLQENKSLWLDTYKETNINYNSEVMQCLFSKISDKDLHQRFASILKVNYLTPKIMAVPLRGEINKIISDPYLATYIALDGYYQQLITFHLSKK